MTATALSEGQVFGGRYRVVRCIASGGMAAVYEVLHLETQRTRALKVMLPETLTSADLRDRFQREARITAGVHSDFLVDVLDAGIDETTQMPFLVMELLRGEDLGAYLKRRGALDPSEVLTYLRQLAIALAKLHASNIVHRDLKPENLFVTQTDEGMPKIKILDFGISKVLMQSARGTATQSIGTPLYMAPEQFETGQVSKATDVYAFGMIAYTLLVGMPYWNDEYESIENVFVFARKVALGPSEPATVRARRRGRILPALLDQWFSQVTAVEPDKRFDTAARALDALTACFAIPPIRSEPPKAASEPPSAYQEAHAPPPSNPSIASMDAGARGPSAPAGARARLALGLALGAVVVCVGAVLVLRSTVRPASPNAAESPSSAMVVIASAASSSPLSASTPPAAEVLSAHLPIIVPAAQSSSAASDRKPPTSSKVGPPTTGGPQSSSGARKPAAPSLYRRD